MAVLLRTSDDLPKPEEYESWVSIEETPEALPIRSRLADLPMRLEKAFEQIIEEWWALAKQLGAEPTSELAHAPACVPNASDLGLMLAWAKIADDCAKLQETTLIVCDDPWLFRHLRSRSGITAGKCPAVLSQMLPPIVRGLLARFRRSLILAYYGIVLRSSRAKWPRNAATLLVYGHPNSTTDGYDDFFGTLMRDMDSLARVFLTDCPLSRYQKIAPDGRSFSLHAWGNPLWVFKLPFAKWRPSRKSKTGKYGWLVRRAAIQEGKTAQSVMNKWHAMCQRRWLEATRPKIVTWPWENYGWERVFVRDAKLVGAKTIGYQHTVVGRHMINHAPASNPDGMLSLPDQIFCNGPAGRNQLSTWGIPQSRLKISGALRYKPASGVTYASSGPVFVALPMKHKLAKEIVHTLQAIKAPDLTFLLKVHPMTTLAFEDTEFLKRTTVPLQQQPGIRAVLYAASTVGLEALLAGLPTLRFIPTSTIAVDILSPPAAAVPVHAGNIEAALKNLQRPPKIPVEAIFSPPQLDVWQDALMRDQL